MKLGTKLTIYLSLIIILVLSGYGYFHILSRRDILIRKMKTEVYSTARTLKVTLERISPLREKQYVQNLIDAVEEYERTLGVIVYHQERDTVFHSCSLGEGIEPYLELIKKSIREDSSQEGFGAYAKTLVFFYSFPLKNRKGKNIGGVSILQHTSFMEEDIRKAKWSILLTIFVLIGGTLTLILFTARRWITQPISRLIDGIQRMGRGDLDARIDMRRGDEISELAQAFNQMAVALKSAQNQIVQEADAKLELERSLRQSEKLATIGQLASGLAHEIGTPLNIISGRVEFTKKRIEDKENVQKNLDIIAQQAERITKIIQQLLGFVRKKKPEQVMINIPALLEATLDFLDHRIQKQGIKVMKDFEGRLSTVMGDADQLQQVFLNLFLNALQAMPNGGTLRVSASSKWISKGDFNEHRWEYLEICVRDTGVGMEREVMEKVFNPFFTTKDQGTGLGLMVSQGIIQDHEGWIEVESEVGKGAWFRVYLPSSQGQVKND